jgi:hypothetical protein
MAIEPYPETPPGDGLHMKSIHNGKHTKTNEIWEKIEQLKSENKILLDGSELNIAAVVVVAK